MPHVGKSKTLLLHLLDLSKWNSYLPNRKHWFFAPQMLSSRKKQFSRSSYSYACATPANDMSGSVCIWFSKRLYQFAKKNYNILRQQTVFLLYTHIWLVHSKIHYNKIENPLKIARYIEVRVCYNCSVPLTSTGSWEFRGLSLHPSGPEIDLFENYSNAPHCKYT